MRLFFALWPNDEVRLQITDNRKCFNLKSEKSRLVSSDNFHLTLHYIGNVTRAEMQCLDRQAKQVNATSFELPLDCTGHFKKPKVFWFGCRRTPQALIDLYHNLGREISECEFTPDTRSFSPHITVARKIIQEPEPAVIKPVHWRVDRFVMVESVSVYGGVRYEVVESYSFC